MNVQKEKWNGTSKSLKTFNLGDTPKWNGRLETFKWNEIEKRGKNGIPPTYITSSALNEKLPQPHKP